MMLGSVVELDALCGGEKLMVAVVTRLHVEILAPGPISILQAEAGQLQVAPSSSPTCEASWSLERVAGIADARIRNAVTGGYLHTGTGPCVGRGVTAMAAVVLEIHSCEER